LGKLCRIEIITTHGQGGAGGWDGWEEQGGYGSWEAGARGVRELARAILNRCATAGDAFTGRQGKGSHSMEELGMQRTVPRQGKYCTNID